MRRRGRRAIFTQVGLAVVVLVTAVAIPLAISGAGSVAQVTELKADWDSGDGAAQQAAMTSEPKSAAVIAQETAGHEIGQGHALGLVSVLACRWWVA